MQKNTAQFWANRNDSIFLSFFIPVFVVEQMILVLKKEENWVLNLATDFTLTDAQHKDGAFITGKYGWDKKEKTKG